MASVIDYTIVKHAIAGYQMNVTKMLGLYEHTNMDASGRV
jgi:hypothetical protein